MFGQTVCRGTACGTEFTYIYYKYGESEILFIVTMLTGGIITYIVLVLIPKLLNFIFNSNINLRFGLSILASLTLWAFVSLCIVVGFLIYREIKCKGKKRIERIKCCRRNNHTHEVQRIYLEC